MENKLLQKYETGELLKIQEQGSSISKDMSNINLKADDEINKLLKTTIKDINIEPAKGIFGKLKNKTKAAFIDTADTNRIIEQFVIEVSKNVSEAEQILKDIKSGIERTQNHLALIENCIEEGDRDIAAYKVWQTENQLLDNFEANQGLELVEEYVVTLKKDKASFQNALIQYQVQYGMQYKIIIATNNTKTSVTNKLREAVSQANLLAEQERLIKNNKEINDMMNDIEMNTAKGIQSMVSNNDKILDHKESQEHYRKLFNINIETIQTTKEIKKAAEESRKLLLTSLEEDNQTFTKEIANVNKDNQQLLTSSISTAKELVTSYKDIENNTEEQNV